MPFLSESDEKKVVDAIKAAETNTSGELRVHIEEHCGKDKDVNTRMQEVFGALNMHQTEARNGILLYIATEDRKVGIWGDEGIHEKVGQQFWEEEIALIIKHFKAGQKAVGLALAIEQIGEKLRQHFPYQSDDVNELDDSISYGKKKKTDDNNPEDA